ncbi:MAG: septation protein A [Rhizobiaceae bacterium]|nr:septation protein A [Rhizobiaceae bacterium]
MSNELGHSAETETRPPLNQWAKLALETGPLVVFIMANNNGDKLAEMFPILAQLGGKIFVGTAFFMVAMTISLIITWLFERKVALMPLITFVMVVIFGMLTLYLQDDFFIKVKPTIINTMFGVAILGTLFIFKTPVMKILFDGPFKLDDVGWTKLSFRWGCFFLFLALVNEVVWRTQTTDFWVAFKLWGVMPMTIIFMMFQYPVMLKHGIEEEEPQP